MKRAKAIGLSLAVMASWSTASEPLPAPASLPPSLLPVEVRTPDVLPAAFSAPNFLGSNVAQPLPSSMTDPVWVQSKPAAALPTVPPAPQPARSAPQPPPLQSVAAGPRVRAEVPVLEVQVPVIPQHTLVAAQPPVPPVKPMTDPVPPAIPEPSVPMTPPVIPAPMTPPVIPAPMTPPTVTAPVPRAPEVPAESPKPKPSEDVIPPRPMAEVSPAPRPAAQPLPRPNLEPEKPWTPTPVPGQHPALPAELPAAPVEFLHSAYPYGPSPKGTFGSPPIRLSRDFPSFGEMYHLSKSQMVNPHEEGSAPATDRVFAQVEYLLWFINRDSIPVLGTTSIDGGNGFLGEPGTVNVIGPGKYGDSHRNGFRVRAGAWINECGTCGIDGSFFFLGKQNNSTTMFPDQYNVITRPISVVNGSGGEFGQIVSAPGFSVGSLVIDDESSLWGADVNARWAICRECDRQTEWFAGFRYLSLNEKITMTEYIIATEGNPFDPSGTAVLVQDSFGTRNDFYGGQIGAVHMQRWGRFDISARGSIALGVTHQEVDINGYQLKTRPGGTTETFVGGLLATTTNIGSHSKDVFSAVPEATLNLGYWVTPHVKLYVGYNMIYWSNVVRPGTEIDRVVNVTNVPNPPVNVPFSNVPRPAVQFAETDLLIQGVQLGAEWRW